MLRHVVFLACSVALLACVMETPSTAQTSRQTDTVYV